MDSLASLTDKQNMLLTQLSYYSHLMVDKYEGDTIAEIKAQLDLKKKDGKFDNEEDEKFSKIIDELCNAGINELVIKDTASDSTTGFGAIAFEDPNGNVGISYRGTDGLKLESANDWVDNIMAMVSGTSVQTLQAENFFDKNKDESGKNYIYGHSKGGQLSEAVYINNYEDIKRVHVLNPQPLNPYSLTLEQLRAIRSDKIDIVIVEGDYVWFLGNLPSYGNVRIVKSNGKNSHLYESINNSYDENGKLVLSVHPWWEYPAYFIISHTVFSSQFVYGSIVRVVNYVRDDLIPNAKEFITNITVWIENKYYDLKEFCLGLKEYLNNIITSAKEWFENAFSKAVDKMKKVENSLKSIFKPKKVAVCRDFSEHTKQMLISGVKDTEEEKWWQINRWDCWYKVEKFFGGMQWNQYANKVDDYYRKLVDMNNASVKDIERIFDEVYEIDNVYGNLMEKNTNYLESVVLNKLVLVRTSIVSNNV